jgi:hypothetical protein
MALICRDDLPDRHNEKFSRTGLDRQITVEIPEEISRTAQRARCSILQINKLKRFGLLDRHHAERPAIRYNAETESLRGP